jgi:microcystin-dependent protein
MSLPFFNWSRTASSNANADSTINWAEGQAPSSVNDSARAMMASTAAYRDDIAGGITTSGTSTAYTVSSYQVFDTLAHLAGQKIAFIAHATNTNAVGVDVTLNVDSLGAKSIRMAPGIALPSGTLVLGTPYIVSYNNTDAVFYLQNMTNPYAIPLAGGIDFWGTSTPNSSFAFPIGQAISRTTYATLFSIMGTTHGIGDGSTTFNLPDKTGRVSVMKEATATRLTTAGSGVDGATMGAAAGAQTQTLLTANLPAYTPAGTVPLSVTSSSSTVVQGGVSSSAFQGGASPFTAVLSGSASAITSTGTGTLTGTAQGGSSTPVKTVQPTIVCNYILRII